MTDTNTLTKDVEQLKSRLSLASYVSLNSRYESITNESQKRYSKLNFSKLISDNPDPYLRGQEFGIPLELVMVAQGIFEELPEELAIKFINKFSDAIYCNNKDLSKLHFLFVKNRIEELKESVLPIWQDIMERILGGIKYLAINSNFGENRASQLIEDITKIECGDETMVKQRRMLICALYSAHYEEKPNISSNFYKEFVAASSRFHSGAKEANWQIVNQIVKQRDLLLKLIADSYVIKSESE